MTTIGMHYDVAAGKEGEFRDGFLGVIEYLRAVSGHVESRLYEDVSSPGSYLILSQWDSKEAFERFIHSAEFAKVTAWGRAGILRGRPRHKVYQND